VARSTALGLPGMSDAAAVARDLEVRTGTVAVDGGNLKSAPIRSLERRAPVVASA
jgi:hypothetical protein